MLGFSGFGVMKMANASLCMILRQDKKLHPAQRFNAIG
jgi:hypothetical protein